jgi:UPF0755 protein
MSINTAGPGEFGRRDTPPAATAAQPAPVSATQALKPQIGTPPPTRRSRGSRSQFVVFLNFLMSLAVFAVICGGAIAWFGKRSFEGPGPNPADTTFIVRPSSGVGTIAQDLETAGLISDARVFGVGVRASGNEMALKAGEYGIKANASMRQIMELLKSGKSIMYSLTIPEGLTVDQAFQRIAASAELSGDMPSSMPPEGALAADTQRFSRGMARSTIIDRMVADQKALVEEIWAKRQDGLPVKDVNEFVTLASIVEKETGVAAERPRVASVFVNRLNKGMRLQSDPTILYGLFGGKGRPADRPIYKSDIEKPTPYNTYIIDGLPPTPIANPGRAALEAVANPEQTDYLYFVADGTGGHVFAETLEEHNKNVVKWREYQKAQGQAAPAQQ